MTFFLIQKLSEKVDLLLSHLLMRNLTTISDNSQLHNGRHPKGPQLRPHFGHHLTSLHHLTTTLLLVHSQCNSTWGPMRPSPKQTPLKVWVHSIQIIFVRTSDTLQLLSFLFNFVHRSLSSEDGGRLFSKLDNYRLF